MKIKERRFTSSESEIKEAKIPLTLKKKTVYCETLQAKQFDNLDRMDKFPESHKSLKLIQEEKYN